MSAGFSDLLPLEHGVSEALEICVRRAGLIFLVVAVNFAFFLFIAIGSRYPGLGAVGIAVGCVTFVACSRVSAPSRSLLVDLFAGSRGGRHFDGVPRATSMRDRQRRTEWPQCAARWQMSWEIENDMGPVPTHSLLLTAVGQDTYVLQVWFARDAVLASDMLLRVRVHLGEMTQLFRCPPPRANVWLPICLIDKNLGRISEASVEAKRICEESRPHMWPA